MTQEGLDFEVLPEHVGTLGQKRLSLAADATLGGTQLSTRRFLRTKPIKKRQNKELNI